MASCRRNWSLGPAHTIQPKFNLQRFCCCSAASQNSTSDCHKAHNFKSSQNDNHYKTRLASLTPCWCYSDVPYMLETYPDDLAARSLTPTLGSPLRLPFPYYDIMHSFMLSKVIIKPSLPSVAEPDVKGGNVEMSGPSVGCWHSKTVRVSPTLRHWLISLCHTHCAIQSVQVWQWLTGGSENRVFSMRSCLQFTETQIQVKQVPANLCTCLAMGLGASAHFTLYAALDSWTHAS